MIVNQVYLEIQVLPLSVLKIQALSMLGTLVNSFSNFDWEAYSSDDIASIPNGSSFMEADREACMSDNRETVYWANLNLQFRQICSARGRKIMYIFLLIALTREEN